MNNPQCDIGICGSESIGLIQAQLISPVFPPHGLEVRLSLCAQDVKSILGDIAHQYGATIEYRFLCVIIRLERKGSNHCKFVGLLQTGLQEGEVLLVGGEIALLPHHTLADSWLMPIKASRDARRQMIAEEAIPFPDRPTLLAD
ncbi:MAG: hypothetical protein RL094_339 [Candidatus Parcubacteria bacterium]|jgi:hypothetical protein